MEGTVVNQLAGLLLAVSYLVLQVQQPHLPNVAEALAHGSQRLACQLLLRGPPFRPLRTALSQEPCRALRAAPHQIQPMRAPLPQHSYSV